jgi:hypothetical protein
MAKEAAFLVRSIFLNFLLASDLFLIAFGAFLHIGVQLQLKLDRLFSLMFMI